MPDRPDTDPHHDQLNCENTRSTASVDPGSGNKSGRSAITGRFVKQSTVARHPKTTVNETKTSRQSKGGKK
jgi:hypothetical protein